jgi:hypothetical protein
MQFKLKTILLIVAVMGLLCAAIAPFLRGLSSEQLRWVGIQFAAILAGIGLTVGNLISSERLFRRRVGNVLGSLYRPRIRFRAAVGLILSTLLFGFGTAIEFITFTTLSGNARPDHWKSAIFMELFFAAASTQSLLKLREVSLVMRIHEGGVVVKGIAYVWDQLRYVRWNEGSGDLSIAIGGKRVQAEVPVAERPSITAVLERNCGAGVLTAVDPRSDQGRTLTNLRGT